MKIPGRRVYENVFNAATGPEDYVIVGVFGIGASRRRSRGYGRGHGRERDRLGWSRRPTQTEHGKEK
jgi:hypothetical protein